MNNFLNASILLLMVLAICISAFFIFQTHSIADLPELKKAADLLKVSLLSDNLNIDEFERDFRFLFRERCGEVYIAEQRREILCSKKGKNAIALELLYFREGRFVPVGVVVYYDS